MGIVGHDEILRLQAAVISAHLADSRSALLAGIPSEFVATLPTGGPPGEHVLRDLDLLSSAGVLADGSVPLGTWLGNAVALAGPRAEAVTFKAALERCSAARFRHLPTGAVAQGDLAPPNDVAADPTPEDWENNFAAIVRLYTEALARLSTDPLSAALRARQVIEQIVHYLHVRELGPAARRDVLDIKLQRLELKGVVPRHIGACFMTVQGHAGAVIHPDALLRDIAPRELEPCLKSLEFVVDWFFRTYLKRASLLAPLEGHSSPPPAGRSPSPHEAAAAPLDATPANLTGPINGSTRVGTGIGEFLPVWRSKATASTLVFYSGEATLPANLTLRIDGTGRRYFVGSKPNRKDGTPNDLMLRSDWVSQDAASLTLRDTDVVLTNTSTRDNVFVRTEVLPAGTSRALRHGDPVQLGRVVGTFMDGRYYAAAPPVVVDAATGLLSREGLVVEISQSLAARAGRTLFVIRCTPEPSPTTAGAAPRDPEYEAVLLTLALHRAHPALPVGRIGASIAVLLDTQVSASACTEVAARATPSAFVSGYLRLDGGSEQATARLEACLGALSRLAIAGRTPTAPEDLSKYALVPTPIGEFSDRVQPLFKLGGGAVLFALSELERLEQLAPRTLPVLELELLEMLGARMGPRDVVSFAGRGLLVLGTPGDPDRVAHDVGVAWHARGPVIAGEIEIDRALATHLLTVSDLVDLELRAESLVRSGIGALGLAGFPAPLALMPQGLEGTRNATDRARRLLRACEAAWRLLAFAVQAAARAARAQTAPAAGPARGTWPAPWRDLARTAASRLSDQHARVLEVANIAKAADGETPLRDAMDLASTLASQLAASAISETALERSLPRLERATREIVGSLAPLRGWTLVAVESSEVIDVDGVTQRIEYVDYTGPSARGARQRVTVMGFRGLGRFVYLVRWDDRVAIALEPFVRCARSPITGDDELFLAEAPITSPGTHTYRSIDGVGSLELPVTAKQLGH